MTLRDFFEPDPVDGLVNAELCALAVATGAVIALAVYGLLHLVGLI